MYLNYIQLKSARCVLNLGVREIGLLIQTSRTTISKLEHNIIKLEGMRLAERRNNILNEFFKKNNIIFLNNHNISYIPQDNVLAQEPPSYPRITRFQLRAARTIINKTQVELANLINVLPTVIMYAENHYNEAYLKPKNNIVITNLLTIFSEHGVSFPNDFSIIFKN